MNQNQLVLIHDRLIVGSIYLKEGRKHVQHYMVSKKTKKGIHIPISSTEIEGKEGSSTVWVRKNNSEKRLP